MNPSIQVAIARDYISLLWQFLILNHPVFRGKCPDPPWSKFANQHGKGLEHSSLSVCELGPEPKPNCHLLCAMLKISGASLLCRMLALRMGYQVALSVMTPELGFVDPMWTPRCCWRRIWWTVPLLPFVDASGACQSRLGIRIAAMNGKRYFSLCSFFLFVSFSLSRFTPVSRPPLFRQ